MFWVLQVVWISASREICKEHLTLKWSVFSWFFCTIASHFPDVFGTILLMWRLIKKIYLWFHFHTNIFVKLFTKEANLFCSGGRPNFNVLDLFVRSQKYGNIYSTEEQVVLQLQYSYEYDNWNSFKNRSKWYLAEMHLRRFSTVFRTATIKSTHSWLFLKCSWSSC